ncbi:hypothetical protein K8I61_17915 [bacterium]|nr:hypothetical protein [bacterium]
MRLSAKVLGLTVLAAMVAFALIDAPRLVADEDSPLHKQMEEVRDVFKAIKKAVENADTAGVKTNAETIAKELANAKNFDPPQNKDRKDEFLKFADEAVVAANDLAGATGMGEIVKKYRALGNSCDKCHDIFRPEDHD